MSRLCIQLSQRVIVFRNSADRCFDSLEGRDTLSWDTMSISNARCSRYTTTRHTPRQVPGITQQAGAFRGNPMEAGTPHGRDVVESPYLVPALRYGGDYWNRVISFRRMRAGPDQLGGDLMNKKAMTETEICQNYITPAIGRSGWDKQTQIRREFSFTAGRVSVRGKVAVRGGGGVSR